MSFTYKFRGGSRPILSSPGNSVPLPDQFVGIEMEVENCKGSPHFKYWTSKLDGSLRNGVEYVTPPIVGDDIKSAIDEFFGSKSWFDVSVRTGYHVHIDMTQERDTFDSTMAFITAYFLTEELFFEYAGQHRKTTGFSYPSSDMAVAISRAIRHYYEGDQAAAWGALVRTNRYFALNLHSMHQHGTLEFRHLEMPSWDESYRAFDWIRMILCLKKYSIGNNPVDVARDFRVNGSKQMVANIFSQAGGSILNLIRDAPSSVYADIRRRCVFVQASMAPQQKTIDNPNNPLLNNKKKKTTSKKKAAKATPTEDPLEGLRAWQRELVESLRLRGGQWEEVLRIYRERNARGNTQQLDEQTINLAEGW